MRVLNSSTLLGFGKTHAVADAAIRELNKTLRNAAWTKMTDVVVGYPSATVLNAERVVFKEPVPVSRNEKIEVTLLTPAEKDVGTREEPKEVTREEDGKLVWRLDLKPGEKREVPLKFSVEYPAEMNVSGLE